MVRNGIPTAGYEEFDSASAAIEYLSTNDGPIVVKLDGLAAGKGVVVARDSKEAIEAVRELSSGRREVPYNTRGDAGGNRGQHTVCI